MPLPSYPAVWFGTKEKMQWIPAPAVDVQAGRQGSTSSQAFLSGGAWVRRSKTAARHYAWSWNMRRTDEVQVILDYASGMYGPGPLYYSDPFFQTRNVFPAYWAQPSMNYYDGPVVVDDTRPTLINNGVSTNGYPVESVQYKVTSTSKVPSIFLPIPEGYTIYLGAHGSLQSGNATVTVTPVISSLANGTTADLTLLTPSSTTRTNAQYSYASGYIGVTVSFKSTSTGVIQLDGLIAQVAPDGAVLPSGGFVGGQGTSGMSMVSEPSYSQYNAVYDRVGVAVELVETEAWT